MDNYLFKEIPLFLLVFSLFIGGCFAKNYDPNDPGEAFIAAKGSYDDEDYELALTRLGSFKSRFPYSSQATAAELLIADAYFALGRYAEAAVSYRRFAQLHPNHAKKAYALFQVGQSHWVEAPAEVDREQDYTQKALAAWRQVVSLYPHSPEAKKAEQMIEEGERRVAGSFAFIADFYCAQKIYHACAYRHIEVAKTFARFQDLASASYRKALFALEKVLAIKKSAPQKKTNIYLKNFTASELASYIESLRKKIPHKT